MPDTQPLSDLAKVIRSKNAGPWELTLDIMFSTREAYEHVRDSGVLTQKLIAELYSITVNDVITCMFFEPPWRSRRRFCAAAGREASANMTPSVPSNMRRCWTSRSRSLIDMEPTPRAQDPQWFRRILSQYPTGVCVITATDAVGAPVGVAVGSFTSVSMDPPLIGFLPSTTSTSWPKIEAVRRFCVNVLSATQESVCRAFALSGGDKFADLAWRPSPGGSPVLEGAVAWIDCVLETVHPAGDHFIVLGRVVDLDLQGASLPLLFFQGGYGRFAPLSFMAHDRQLGAQLALIERARPMLEQAAEAMRAQIVVSHCDGLVQSTLATAGTPHDRRTVASEIGQRIHVTAPIGIWWMAFARPEYVQAWLAGVREQELRTRYESAMARIRAVGYCLGLSVVREHMVELFSGREDPHSDPSPRERELIQALQIDPLAYAPSRLDADASAESQTDIVSLWAPTFSHIGEVDLGIAVAGYCRDGTALSTYSEQLLGLARGISQLAAA